MKIYLVKYSDKSKGYATVEGAELGFHPEARIAIVYEDGKIVKAIFPLDQISGISEATKEQTKLLVANFPV